MPLKETPSVVFPVIVKVIKEVAAVKLEGAATTAWFPPSEIAPGVIFDPLALTVKVPELVPEPSYANTVLVPCFT